MKILAILVALTFTLSACGGGGGDTNTNNVTNDSNNSGSPSTPTDSNNDNQTPNAGDNEGDNSDTGAQDDIGAAPIVDVKAPGNIVRKGTTIVIDSVVTGGNEQLTYLWEQISGPTATILNNQSASLTVTLPETSSPNQEDFVFALTVTNSDGLSTYTETTIESINAMTQLQAAALLHQGTLGPTYAEIQAVIGKSEEEWIDAQLESQTTYHMPFLENYPNKEQPSHINRIDAWWKASLNAPDQLRQRVAFALSEIFVVSDANSALRGEPEGMTNYYDMLLKNAFGNFRTLLESVTLSPVMGVYLSHLGNEKADLAKNIRPDENYAREVMQLFTIGLDELNLDGTVKLDDNGNTIPTYSQLEIGGFARVFTGWTFAYSARWNRPSKNYTLPMQPFEDYHSSLEKHLLNGEVIPADTGAEESMKLALDNLFMHPNVAPFISKQLIQRLVKSNPTPAYVERVATIFNDNGQGERGDLAAVVKAILLDDEARKYSLVLEHTGKIKEPILTKLHFWRTLNASSQVNRYYTWNLSTTYGQGPLLSPSVFNFFRPDHRPSELLDSNLVAPELQIATDSNMISTTNNHYSDLVWRMAERKNTLNPNTIYMYGEAYISLLEESGLQALLDHYDVVYFAGSMSDETRSALTDLDSYFANRTPADRISQLLYMISLSPEFNYQD
ncbi:DUF1800 domain-containing protein [Pseudoalteromonas luteoviolacea]|uniref:DUF1800 domain-containing protein n=1 Tax=Pseudoalteromonas luteoviolacea S4060-1 TaxID=1365257 RepID=A0A167LPQ6_9GAMM|nr:DUF1800 domain-containing protein [Pseudoalteromonas luteoviolacea]KZN64986.1 hypothetical protein N478_02985 [Pseudoalteromonas luteoviolacea S4060-1]